ncbi:Protein DETOXIFICATION 29-like [Forsythia ovata]|uniref:Protein DETOXIFICATION 29-like n=1 Tax=Forsythia ovata TaxID=205694 RepID=A0ABD1PZN4_9LAMI
MASLGPWHSVGGSKFPFFSSPYSSDLWDPCEYGGDWRVRKEDLKVQVEVNNILQISGERVIEQEDENDKWHRVERRRGSFSRKFRLPENAKLDEIKGGLEHGVLTLTVPKKETHEGSEEYLFKGRTFALDNAQTVINGIIGRNTESSKQFYRAPDLINIVGWAIMLAIGFNAAISVRVSNELGAGHPRTAKFSVVKVVYDLTPLLAFSIIVNTVQPTLSGVAIGAGRQTCVAYVNIACYYLFGIPLGIILGYVLHMGVKGIWCGLLSGTILQTCVLFWIIYGTNWNKEASFVRENRTMGW